MLYDLNHTDISTRHISHGLKPKTHTSFTYSITDTEKVQSPMLKENSELSKWHFLYGFAFTHLHEMETVTPYVYLHGQSRDT